MYDLLYRAISFWRTVLANKAVMMNNNSCSAYFSIYTPNK